MRSTRIFIVLAILSVLLLVLPAIATARGGGGCGGQCACSSGSPDTTSDGDDSGSVCRRGGGHGKGKAVDGRQHQGQGQGQGQGRAGGGHGQQGNHGNHAKMADARELVHNHTLIERKIEDIPGGVRTVTTSKDAELVVKLQRHVTDMKEILENGGRVRGWDPLFVELFEHADEIEMKIERLENGLEVRETSENPRVTQLIRAHARKVDEFVAEGPDAAHRPTEVPAEIPTEEATSE